MPNSLIDAGRIRDYLALAVKQLQELSIDAGVEVRTVGGIDEGGQTYSVHIYDHRDLERLFGADTLMTSTTDTVEDPTVVLSVTVDKVLFYSMLWD